MAPFNQILRDAQAGRLESVEVLIAKYSPSVEQECAKFGLWQHPDWSHSDLMQEIGLQVWMKLDQFHGMESDQPEVVFEQWVRTTARNVVTSLHRHRTAKKRKPETAHQVFNEVTQAYSRNRIPARSASSVFVCDEEAERLRQAMRECLDERGQQILNLRVVEGLALKQISVRLSLTYDQVRYKYEASLKVLQERLTQN